MKEDINVTVSPICTKDGKKFAYVSFEDQGRTAEGKIPDCAIIFNKGFNKEEVAQFEEYMCKELEKLKNMAAGIDVFRAFMK